MDYMLSYLYVLLSFCCGIFDYLYLFCGEKGEKNMIDQQLPFRFIPVSKETISRFQDGKIISTLDQCGIFLCRGGEIEVAFEDETYRMRRGDMYVYVTSTLVRVLHKSEDAEGYMVEVDLNYAIPIVNRVVKVENLLYLRRYPCISLSERQYLHLEHLLEQLQHRMETEELSGMAQQCRSLTVELLKSMGQTIFFEVLNTYFANQPLNPLPQGKKDLVFHNFMLALFRHYHSERDVAFYARMQHLAPRYFSTVIKEKSGSSALQWIVKMVIADAKQMLESSDLSIKEIAGRLNFPTQSFFGKYFKQYVGVSPKEYRANHL